jgi:hypothetical protein
MFHTNKSFSPVSSRNTFMNFDDIDEMIIFKIYHSVFAMNQRDRFILKFTWM